MNDNVREIFEGLNPQQKNAVQQTEGPVLIVAGAGSGKTRVLTCRIANILSRGVPPSSVLSLTFTKKAAEEMKSRVADMVGSKAARGVVMGTFHSVFIRFLRDYCEFLGYPKQFTVYDTSDSVSMIKTCLKELNLDDKTYKPKSVLSRISEAKNNLVTPAAYVANSAAVERDRNAKMPRLSQVYDLYWKKCRNAGVMDFDDILFEMNILLRDNSAACEEISSRFRYILVDEYQDTNRAQYIILKKLASRHHNICVVGDDSQSIYAFRGARIENILNFKKDYPECRMFRLEQNYRSTSTIVNAANSLIAHNESRIPKTCFSDAGEGEKIRLIKTYTEQEEASLIVSSIIDCINSHGASYQDFAVLYRTNAQSRAIEEALRRRNIPYMIYSGNSFFERAEVKDLMAYFKLAVNPNDDESFKRIVNKPSRGIGDTSLLALTAAAYAKQKSLMDAVYDPDILSFGIKPAAVARIKGFADMILRFASKADSEDAYRLAMEIATESGIWMLYKSDMSVEGQARFANVEELCNSIQSYIEQCENDVYEDAIAAGEDVSLPSGGTSGEDVGLPSGGAAGEDVSLPSGGAPGERTPIDGTDRSSSSYGGGLPSVLVTLGEYLENVSLLSAVDVDDEDSSNKVALMTAHSSKGLEFPYVFVAGMEENLFPSGSGQMLRPSDVEEERRLFYVAVTRAKKALWLSFSDTRMRNGRSENNPVSRFVQEIDPMYIANPGACGMRQLRSDAFWSEVHSTRASGPHSFSLRSAGLSPASSHPTGLRPSGPSPAGLHPAGLSPSGSHPAGLSPAGLSPSGSHPAGLSPFGPRQHPASSLPDPDFQPSAVSDLRVGQTVEHNRFGKGVLKELVNDGSGAKAVIDFDAFGQKTLLLKYAKIRIL